MVDIGVWLTASVQVAGFTGKPSVPMGKYTIIMGVFGCLCTRTRRQGKGITLMNILSITAQKPDSTGSGVYLAETVKGFRAAGHKVAVIAGIDAQDTNDFPEDVLFYPVRFRTEDLAFPVVGMSDEMPYEATRYRDMTPSMVDQFSSAFTTALDHVVEVFRPDAIICHHLYLLTALVAQSRVSCPVAAVCHSTDMRQMRTLDLQRDYIRAGIQALDAVLALHDVQKQEISALYDVPLGRIHVVGTGFSSTVFHPGTVVPQTGHIDVAYAGKIWRKKGVESLLHCLDRLPYASDAFTLRLAGGYSSQSEYDLLVELARSCPYPVEFLGRLSQNDLACLYRRSNVFVLPSFFEGLPLVVIEALACGCNVVVTDLPGIRGWLDAELPDAPVTYVKPPRFLGADEPIPEDLECFEQDLATAMVQSAARPRHTTDVHHLSWDSLCRRIVETILQ